MHQKNYEPASIKVAYPCGQMGLLASSMPPIPTKLPMSMSNVEVESFIIVKNEVGDEYFNVTFD